MADTIWLKPPLTSLFIPMILTYFGIALVFPNASTMAMSYVSDKAYGSAVMNFVNMGLVTLIVIGVGQFSNRALLLPIVYLIICLGMLGAHQWLKKQH